MRTFEYAMLPTTASLVIMNELGADGWELVLAVNHLHGGDFYFKREITAGRPQDYSKGIPPYPEA